MDTLVIKNINKLEFNIYRKPTSTERFIPCDSNHPSFQKRSAFASLVHRLVNTPLSSENHNKEINYLKNSAIFNGYNPKLIDNLVKNTKQKKLKNSKTTLKPIQIKKERWTSITFTTEKQAKKIKKVIENSSDNHITFSAKNKLKFKLNNPKDKTKNEDKSGIYEIKCNDCEKRYIGQTKRKISKRFKEHASHTKFGNIEKSAVAKHCIEENHSVNNIKLIKSVEKPFLLNAWETLYINKTKEDQLMNIEKPPFPNSKLLNL